MKRALVLFCFLFWFVFTSKSQSLLDTTTKNYYGIHLISNWSSPVYFSFTHLKPKWHSYGVKAGFGSGYQFGYFYNSYPSTYYSFGYSDYTQTAKTVFVTPVYIPMVFREDGKLFYFSLGAPFGYSKDHLNRVYANDPLFGNFSRSYDEQHFYSALELGFSYWIDLGKNLSFSMGANSGVRLLKPTPFEEQFMGANKSNTYYPGTSKGFYFSMHLGILFSKFKK
jgi:hypothetical protein